MPNIAANCPCGKVTFSQKISSKMTPNVRNLKTTKNHLLLRNLQKKDTNPKPILINPNMNETILTRTNTRIGQNFVKWREEIRQRYGHGYGHQSYGYGHRSLDIVVFQAFFVKPSFEFLHLNPQFRKFYILYSVPNFSVLPTLIFEIQLQFICTNFFFSNPYLILYNFDLLSRVWKLEERHVTYACLP